MSVEILADVYDAASRIFDVALGIAKLATDRELVVLMGEAQSFEPGDIGFKTGLVHQPRIARSNSLGHGELVRLSFTEVF